MSVSINDMDEIKKATTISSYLGFHKRNDHRVARRKMGLWLHIADVGESDIGSLDSDYLPSILLHRYEYNTSSSHLMPVHRHRYCTPFDIYKIFETIICTINDDSDPTIMEDLGTY